MEKQGRKGKQGDSVSQHRWQQSQHDAALLLPRGLQASQQSHILRRNQEGGKEAALTGWRGAPAYESAANPALGWMEQPGTVRDAQRRATVKPQG